MAKKRFLENWKMRQAKVKNAWEVVTGLKKSTASQKQSWRCSPENKTCRRFSWASCQNLSHVRMRNDKTKWQFLTFPASIWHYNVAILPSLTLKCSCCFLSSRCEHFLQGLGENSFLIIATRSCFPSSRNPRHLYEKDNHLLIDIHTAISPQKNESDSHRS